MEAYQYNICTVLHTHDKILVAIINVKVELSRGLYQMQSLVMYNEARPYQCNQCGHTFSRTIVNSLVTWR